MSLMATLTYNTTVVDDSGFTANPVSPLCVHWFKFVYGTNVVWSRWKSYHHDDHRFFFLGRYHDSDYFVV